MRVLHDAGIDQSGFGAAEGASQQLPVLREAAGFGMRILQDAGRDQGGWSVADAQGISWQYCGGSFDMMSRHEAGIDQGGFRAAEGPSQQLTVLRKATGVGVRILQDAGRDQGGWFF